VILACIDGGLICGPLLISLLVALTGWLGLKKLRCTSHGCKHKCEEPNTKDMGERS
jgi:hypothetical protein